MVVDDESENVFILVLLYHQLGGVGISITLRERERVRGRERKGKLGASEKYLFNFFLIIQY